MLLSVENLVTKFPIKRGDIYAVNDVSFHIEKGRTLAVVGESGSGKSVTALSVMRLIAQPGRIESGKIFLKDEDLLRLSNAKMQSLRGNEVSMIFQEPMTSLNPVYTVKFQISEAVRRHMDVSRAAAEEKALEMLKLVGIPSPEKRLNNYPHEMSGGMRQRVMIAMALACDPDMLIADEPTTALDVTIQAQIIDLLYKLRERYNMGMILITHDLGIVAEVADDVVVMYCGRIVERAPVRELFKKSMHPYTVGLINSIPRMDRDAARLPMIRGMAPNPLMMPPGCLFSSRCDSCMPICRQREPDAAIVSDRHEVSCHLHCGAGVGGSGGSSSGGGESGGGGGGGGSGGGSGGGYSCGGGNSCDGGTDRNGKGAYNGA